MAKSTKVKATLLDARMVKAVWEAHPDFAMGGIQLNDFIAVYGEADSLDKVCAAKDVEATGLKANRTDKVRQLNELVTRFRSSIRGIYGPDSPQYEQAGGTRSSSRKAPKSKANAASA